ncbi:hypothetical protein DFQ28_004173, partial [Apophysomyces sp. BC1034]
MHPFYTDSFCSQRVIVVGDFNYTYLDHSHRWNAPSTWHAMLTDRFADCMAEMKAILTPTFRRGSSTRSLIDYNFISRDLVGAYVSSTVEFIQWSDNALMSVSLSIGAPKPGKGIWRANPRYAASKRFRQRLASALSDLYPQLSPTATAQEQWEE